MPWSVTPTRSWMPSPSLGEDEDSVGRQRHVVGAVVVVGVNVGVGVVAGSQSRRRPERMTENIRPVREGHGRFAVVPPNTRPPHHGRWDAGQAFGRWAGYCIGGWADAAYCFGLGLVAAQFAHTGERDSLVVELRGFEPRTFSLRTRRATNCATAPKCGPHDNTRRHPSRTTPGPAATRSVRCQRIPSRVWRSP